MCAHTRTHAETVRRGRATLLGVFFQGSDFSGISLHIDLMEKKAPRWFRVHIRGILSHV